MKREEEVRNRLTIVDNIQDIEHQVDSLYNTKLLTELKNLNADNRTYMPYIRQKFNTPLETITNKLNYSNQQKLTDKLRYFNNKEEATIFLTEVINSRTPLEAEIPVEIDVWIRLDSAHCYIVKIDDDILDKRYSWLAECQIALYCTINNETYYKYQNDILYHRKIENTEKFSKEIFGLKYQNGRFKYYQTPPEKVQKWCQENIKTNGFHAIRYTYNKENLYIIQEVFVDSITKQLLQKK